MTPPINDWLRYTHLEKLYGYLPGMTEALPTIFGLTSQEYTTDRAAYSDAAREVAADLLQDPRLASLVDAIPVTTGQRILAVGDSTTDDLQSWAEILRHLLQLRRPDDSILLTNAGLSAHTTAMILRRWPATLAAASPHLVVCALGGNDVTRVGPAASKTVVSREETLANLRELRRIAAETSPAAWVWMTPASVLEDRVQQYPPFRFGVSEWRNDDIITLVRAITAFEEPTIDLTAVFGVPPDPDLLGADGVHPTLAGQRAITIAVLKTLATIALPRADGLRSPGAATRPAAGGVS